MGYLDKALETVQQQGGRVINHDLLDDTLVEIGKVVALFQRGSPRSKDGSRQDLFKVV